MGVRLPWMISGARQILKLQSFITREKADIVPKGHVAVYVEKDLLKRAGKEFGFDQPMGGLTIPCREDAFVNLTLGLH
ncbi:hypothetical protein GOBAR_AA04618 [Gossypium barbadense]|uniref:Auxin-responsive protein n=1 Tax=Gossypium barbadense TaxID=3634 RepID=A0A2P5YKA3_GOSBA|nr:hypothetical protein GOBAR_AA04618 [Gossypium barbadense]